MTKEFTPEITRARAAFLITGTGCIYDDALVVVGGPLGLHQVEIADGAVGIVASFRETEFPHALGPMICAREARLAFACCSANYPVSLLTVATSKLYCKDIDHNLLRHTIAPVWPAYDLPGFATAPE